jgi:hypothetical protein
MERSMNDGLVWVNDHHEVVVDGVFLRFEHFLHLVDRLLRQEQLPEHLDVKRPEWPATIALDPERMLRVANGLVDAKQGKSVIGPDDDGWEPSFRKLPALIAHLDRYRGQAAANRQ